MSTNAIIAKSASPEQGRWVHWDGNPNWLGKSICELVRRDGTENATAVLVDENLGWSCVDPAQGDSVGDGEIYPEARFFAVPGYGVAYTAEQAGNDPNFDVESEEWGYLISDNGDIEVIYHGKSKGIVNALSDTFVEEMAEIEEEAYGD